MTARWLLSIVGPLLISVCLAYAQDIYVPNQGSDNMTIFDRLDPADVVTRPLGDQPHEGIARHDARYVFVSNRLDHNVSVYDALTRLEVDVDGDASNGLTRIPVGLQPHGVALTSDDRYLVVTNDGSNDLTIVDAATFAIVSTVPSVGDDPHMVALSPDDREAWIGNIGGGDVSIVDMQLALTDPANAVLCVTPGGTGPDCRIPTGAGAEGLDFTHDGRHVYVANGGANTVTVIDAVSRQAVGTLSVGGSPRRVHVRPDGLRAYVTQLFGQQIAVIDTATHQLVPSETITNIDRTLGMDFTADSKTIYVGNFFGATVTSIDLDDTSSRQTYPAGTSPDSAVILPVVVQGVVFTDEQTLTWRQNFVADSYVVYRGPLTSLPANAGDCANALDPDPTDTSFPASATPGAGTGDFYLVGTLHDGVEEPLGFSSDGQPRIPATACN